MSHFLLTYDPHARTREIVRFEDALEAFDAYARRERELLASDVEVVLLSAESEEVLHITHRRFFEEHQLQFV